MKKIKYIFCCFILFSCSSSNSDLISEKEGAVIKNDEVCFDCFFYLFDKYEHDYDLNEIEAWKDSVVGLFKEGKAPSENSVFEKNGGGPLGAHWNSDASLFCVMIMDKDYGVEVDLNDSIFSVESSKTRMTEEKSMVQFSIPSNKWIKALKPITEADYNKVYTPEEIENLSSSKNTPLGVGQFVEIKLMSNTHEKQLFSNVLHVAYGD